MAVDFRAARFGYRTYSPTTHCPHCGHQMKQMYDEEARRQLSQCVWPGCPEISGKSDNQLIKAIRRRKHEACNTQKEVSTMATLTATESTYEVLPSGKYALQITDIEDQVGNFGPQFKIKLEVVAPKKYEGKWLNYWCSQKLTSGGKMPSKLWGFTEAVFGRKLAKGENLDTDDLVGRRVYGMVGIDGDYNKILSVEPIPADKQPAFPLPGAKPAKDETEFEVGDPGAAFSDDDDPFGNE